MGSGPNQSISPFPHSALRVVFYNRQRRVRLNTRWLRGAAQLGLERSGALAGNGALSRLAEIDVAIVSDSAIARCHEEFMGIAGPTDVLTFDHGEIVISAETAEDHARRHRHPVEVEIALYMVHGFLHLNGFDDRTPPDAARMRLAQMRILRWCRSQLPPP